MQRNHTQNKVHGLHTQISDVFKIVSNIMVEVKTFLIICQTHITSGIAINNNLSETGVFKQKDRGKLYLKDTGKKRK